MIAHDDTTPVRPADLPPEAHNDEQDPVGQQAQDVAEDAMRESSHTTSPLESTKPDASDYDVAPDSTGDLVDEMRRMEGEGRIDMSAFAGEPNHDDEPDTYGGVTTDDNDEEWVVADGETLAEHTEEGLADEHSLEDDDGEDIERIMLDTDGEEEE